MKADDFSTTVTPNWCPGCGNFGLFAALREALARLNLPAEKIVFTYGIGCHGKMIDFMNVNGFDGLHGRPVPVAEGIKLGNHELKVVAMSGDGDAYGEGLSHMLNAARGNHNMTYFVHDNQIYGLTTGQASPTTVKGTKTKSTPEGLIDEPINPIALAISAGATFVARAYAGDIPFTTEIMLAALQHKGFAIVDIFQPCVSFNKVNTYDWFRQNLYKLENHNASDKMAALQKAFETAKLPIGIFYNIDKPTYEEQVTELAAGPLAKQSLVVDRKKLLQEFL
ncbi:MAG: thiamine pyrophosphate-dependent enzyme [Candidatus Woesearchaeota archaeon]